MTNKRKGNSLKNGGKERKVPKKEKGRGWVIGLNGNVVEETIGEGNGNEVDRFKAYANHNNSEDSEEIHSLQNHRLFQIFL